MPNLGSSDTPVEGQSFGLPAGAELGEDNGELVIKDSSGTIILRRNETASEWQFEGTDLSGINAIDASSATFGSLSTAQVNYDGLSDGQDLIVSATNKTDPQYARVVRPTSAVSTTAVAIATYGILSEKAVVANYLIAGEDGAGNRFAEELTFGDGSSIVNVSNLFERGTPASRSYSVSGQDLELAMSSDTYDIIASGEVVRP